MTEADKLHRLRTLAKRYARANRIAQHQALDLIAGQLGFLSWTKLVSANKKGWHVDSEHLAVIETFASGPLPTATFLEGDPEAMDRRLEYLEQAEQGTIGGRKFRLQTVLGDVVVAGEGWNVRVPENAGAIPIVETYTAPDADCPVLDPEFLGEVLKLAKNRAVRARAQISTDWPRRSTKPDLDGVLRHPLSDIESAVWFCLHCDGKITGVELADNLWHCPGCGASPLDIFDTAFWSDDGGKTFPPASANRVVDRDQPDYEMVDGRPKLDLNEDKVVLLIRSALLDDATNVGEQLGALQAEIAIDNEDGLWIALEADLWPEDKEPVQALEVARLLGLEVEVGATLLGAPFAWPGLGKIASSTSEYTRMMLDAYAQYGGWQRTRTKASKAPS